MQNFKHKTLASYLSWLAMFFLLCGPVIGNVSANEENSFIDVICSANGIRLVEASDTPQDSLMDKNLSHCEVCNFTNGMVVDNSQPSLAWSGINNQASIQAIEKPIFFAHYRFLTFSPQAPPQL